MLSILGAALVFVSVVGYALAWGRVLRLPFALTLVSACCAITAILYLGALGNILRATQFVLLVGGLGALLFWIKGRPRAELGRELLAPAPVVFAIGCLILFIVTRGLLLVARDEFADWGAISKILLLTNQLPHDLESSMFVSYPPGDDCGFRSEAARDSGMKPPTVPK